jgi:superfamily II DNA or RNA helicase
MLTIFDLIENKTETWIKEQRENNQSAVGSIIKYIEKQGKLREPQLKSIETYLWLKFVGQNKALSDIIRSGLLFDEKSVSEYRYHQVFGDNYTLQFLNAFAQDNELKKFQKELLNDPKGLIHNWNEVLNELLHDFEYPNFLFSLPMGAGKTYLMAAFIYLDLYFAGLDLTDKRFAHNFVVFAPHAAKTAILPSLQTIKDFKPEWILPSNEAKLLKQKVHIEILDSLSSKRKDKLHGNNPNLEKVNRLTQINNFGLVFITNAEKVVLERYDDKDLVFLKTGQMKIGQEVVEEIKKTNELREKLSQIQNLSVILDEVHHAYDGTGQGEKKLRQSVNILNQHKNVVSVLGLSGTPFLKTIVKVGNEEIRINQIQDIVYNYSLADGIGKFLKRPEVTKVEGVREKKFISGSLDEFFENYDITYSNGARSKVAFYCPSKRVLHEEILPVINEWYAKNRSGKENEIFKFYSDDKEYKLPKESKAIFNNLDKPYSDKRVILLVAIGTEGWDCRSLTGVVLPRNETTKNFVLQTTCRCLREVESAKIEKAMIYLSEGNYEILNQQLKDNYQLTINDLRGKKENELPVIVRKPEIGQLKFKQVHKHFKIEIIEETTDFKKQLQQYKIEKFKTINFYSAIATKGKIGRTGISGISEAIVVYATMTYSYDNFLYDLSKQLYGRFTETDLFLEYGEELKAVHKQILENNEWIGNHPEIETVDVVKDIASCFASEEKYTFYIVEDDVVIELLEWILPANIQYGGGITLPPIQRNDVRRISGRPASLQTRWDEMMDLDGNPDPQNISLNYIPYRFDSDYEKIALLDMMQIGELKNLEVYYNGYNDNSQLQSFVIRTPLGEYTPDFLILKRKGPVYKTQKDFVADKQKGSIEKVLMIETKGRPFYTPEFQQKEQFVKTTFKQYNPNFEYVCFIDEGKNDFSKHLTELKKIINAL